mmetsp:Transcript_2751/g.7206  ORF Transcript_2751/g.7206 Transcript_2751/m.7206 type:complete len:330 (-) Transcript_2751:513-1502(-)
MQSPFSLLYSSNLLCMRFHLQSTARSASTTALLRLRTSVPRRRCCSMATTYARRDRSNSMRTFSREEAELSRVRSASSSSKKASATAGCSYLLVRQGTGGRIMSSFSSSPSPSSSSSSSSSCSTSLPAHPMLFSLSSSSWRLSSSPSSRSPLIHLSLLVRSASSSQTPPSSASRFFPRSPPTCCTSSAISGSFDSESLLAATSSVSLNLTAASSSGASAAASRSVGAFPPLGRFLAVGPSVSGRFASSLGSFAVFAFDLAAAFADFLFAFAFVSALASTGPFANLTPTRSDPDVEADSDEAPDPSFAVGKKPWCGRGECGCCPCECLCC